MENIENRQELEEIFYKKGFPRELMTGVVAALQEGNYTQNEQTQKLGVAVEHFMEIKGDELGYRLHVAFDPATSKAYLNSFDAAILNHPKGTREHTFLASNMISAQEAHRMLKYGKKVAVNKDLFNKEGVKYNVWLSIDVDGAKDQNGNYPVLSYHENYFKKRPFDLESAMAGVHVPFQLVREHASPEDFKKAHILEAMITVNNEQQKGFLCVSPGERVIDVYDKDGTLIPRAGQEVRKGKENNAHQPKQQNPSAEEVKKKPWEKGQGVNWKEKSNPGKGMKP